MTQEEVSGRTEQRAGVVPFPNSLSANCNAPRAFSNHLTTLVFLSAAIAFEHLMAAIACAVDSTAFEIAALALKSAACAIN